MPRILCARFPHLGLVVAWRRHPELRGEPVAIASDTTAAAVALAASEAARAAGVHPGQPLRQVRQLCPAAAVVPFDATAAGRRRDQVMEALCAVVPAVELNDEEAYADLSGSHAGHPGEAAWSAAVGQALAAALDGAAPAIGVAATRFVAWMAARESAPRHVRRVRAGEEAAFLAPLPPALLPVDPAVLARLGSLGLDCLGTIAALSPADLQRQFGPEGLTVHRLARGADATSLTVARPPRRLAVRVLLDGAVCDREMLRRGARQAALDLGRLLEEQGLVAGALTLALEGEDGPSASAERVLVAPAGGAEEVWAAVLGLLGAAEPRAPVAALRLEAGALAMPGGRQTDLWRRGEAERDAVARVAARLCDRFGRTAVLRPRLRVDPGDLPERRFQWETVASEVVLATAAGPGAMGAGDRGTGPSEPVPPAPAAPRRPPAAPPPPTPAEADAPISWRRRPSLAEGRRLRPAPASGRAGRP
jgi:DNA polymerase-4